MEKDKDLSEEISFVAHRYREGKFNVQSAWRRMNLASVTGWRRYRVVAAIAVFVVLTAVAGATIYYNSSIAEPSTTIEEVVEPSNPTTIVKAIDFEYAPLPTVLERIKEVYGVDVKNVPEDADDHNLSMHFEGNPVELIDAINEILGTEMTIKQ